MIWSTGIRGYFYKWLFSNPLLFINGLNITNPFQFDPDTCFPRGGSRAWPAPALVGAEQGASAFLSPRLSLRGLDLSSSSHRSQVSSAPFH